MWSGILVLTLGFVCEFASSHTVHLGRRCPTITPFPNLSINKITGNWYVVYKSDTANTCLQWNLTRPDSKVDQLLLKETRQLSLLDAMGVDHTHAVTANIMISNPEVPAKMRIRWPTSLTGKADFIVLDTDYDNYLAIFQCDRAGIVHRRDIVILSREPAINDMFVERVRRLLNSSNVDHKSMSSISHNDCRKNSSRNWHIDGELFGLLPANRGTQTGNLKELSRDVEDYDVSQLEIIGDGIQKAGEFKGSLKKNL